MSELQGIRLAVSSKEASGKMGDGPQILLFDASMVSHKGLRDLVVDTAEENEIPYQFETIPGGGTDAGAIHISGNGVPSLSNLYSNTLYPFPCWNFTPR